MASGSEIRIPVFRPERGEWVAQWKGLPITITDPDLNASAPRPRALAVVKDALERFADHMLPAAIRAASEGCRVILGWVAAPGAEDWECIGLSVDAEDVLWIAVQEYVADEYALWIVGFDQNGHARHLRRAPDMAGSGQPPIHARGALVMTL